jgi:hypothetical protein
VVSDNATGFVSEEFQQFLSRNGVKHLNSAPYHPASNGQAEIVVRKLKDKLKAMKKGDTETQLRRLLFKDHITPSTTTGYSPAELLFNRRLSSALTLLRPQPLAARLQQKSRAADKKTRTFRRGDLVLARNYSTGDHWVPGVIAEVLGATDYQVLLTNGKITHRHVDQLRIRAATEESAGEPWEAEEGGVLPEQLDPNPMVESIPVATPDLGADGDFPIDIPLSAATDSAADVTPPSPVMVPSPQTVVAPRRSQRKRHPPGHLQDYEC